MISKWLEVAILRAMTLPADEASRQFYGSCARAQGAEFRIERQRLSDESVRDSFPCDLIPREGLDSRSYRRKFDNLDASNQDDY